MQKRTVYIVLFSLLSLLPFTIWSQEDASKPGYKTFTAGPQYNRSSFHQWLWGKHYRKEWYTPVQLPLFHLDTAGGGLTVYQRGGGVQTRTLRIASDNNKEYVLRSIDKSFGSALPEIYRNTFVERIFNDQVSVAHPYAAVTVAPMAEAAKIYHTWPRVVYVPEQKAMDSFNTGFANDAYLFEQRPDGNWEEADNFGNSKDIISTEKLLERIREDASHRVDQALYVRSRLFDMFIGDWGRHEDQWRWATFGRGDSTFYQPIPRDRDQVYTKFDGVLLKLVKSAAGLGHLQSFDYNIKDVTRYNFPARNLDRQMANQTTLPLWIATANELQKLLTDEVIENSVKLLPPEVFPLSGQEIIAKLKSRRDKLETFAKDYYSFLAEEVEIVGTKNRDYIEITPLADNSVSVKLHQFISTEDVGSDPYYSRIFFPGETKEIRIFGLDGQDVYDIREGKTDVTVRLIGGPADDDYRIANASGIHIYDSRTEEMSRSPGVRLHLSNDSGIHRYRYDAFAYEKKGISPSIFYSREDRIYAGVSYKVTNQKWRKEPFANKHEVFVRYSINQSAFNLGYEGLVNNFIGKWNLILNGNYDWVRWTNFYGLGNETKQLTLDRDFHRIRSQDGLGSIGFQRFLGKQSSIRFTPFYETIKLLRDTGRFLVKNFIPGSGHTNFVRKHFAGAGMELDLRKWNDPLVPAKGISLFTSVKRVYNIRDEKSFTNYSGNIQFFLPLARWLILSVNNGGATVNGEPEFYQLNSIGGNLLRGFRRERFWGQTVFHNNNELQFIFNVKGNLFNGKAGFVAFADQGRVWLKGEDSNKWHYGYGAGIILVPFNRAFISVQYGISEDDKVIHLSFRGQLRN